MGDLPSPQNMLNLLFDLNYWLQRMLKVPYPLVPRPIGKLAVSGFSVGIRRVSELISGNPKSGSEEAKTQQFFFDEILKEVYSFDGFFSGRNGQADTENFCRKLLARWFRGGAASRVLRIYTQSDIWLKALGPAIAAAPTVKGPNGSEEREGPSGTVLFVPRAFWQDLLTTADPGIETRFRDAARTATLKRLARGEITAAQVPGAIEESVKFQFFKIGHQLVPARFVQHAVANQKI